MDQKALEDQLSSLRSIRGLDEEKTESWENRLKFPPSTPAAVMNLGASALPAP
jgi:hypothetical protein